MRIHQTKRRQNERGVLLLPFEKKNCKELVRSRILCKKRKNEIFFFFFTSSSSSKNRRLTFDRRGIKFNHHTASSSNRRRRRKRREYFYCSSFKTVVVFVVLSNLLLSIKQYVEQTRRSGGTPLVSPRSRLSRRLRAVQLFGPFLRIETFRPEQTNLKSRGTEEERNRQTFRST